MSEKVEGKRTLGRGFWIILVLVILLVMAGTAVGVYVFLMPASGLERELPTYEIPLETFVVNLKDSNYRRYLRTEISVETNEKKVISEMTTKEYKIRDTINTVLSSKTVSDLGDREAIKQELIDAINSHLTQGDVVGLYFNQFIIQ